MKPARIALYLTLVAAGILIGAGYGRWYGPRSQAGTPVVELPKPKGYHCPMHPNFRSEKPGECGICGMKLVPDDAPNHPQHAPAQVGGGQPEHNRESMPMGTIRVSPEKQQLIGVKYGEATLAAGLHTFRAVGKVAMDETRVAKVQTKIEGWIERVFVDFTGKLVQKGQPLLTIYSPEMLASQQEYLLAIRGREVLKDSPLAGTRQQSESLIEAARRRLELWDLSEAQIEEVARTGKPMKNVTLYSPIDGYVMMRNSFPKQRITPETELYTVADLSKVWIMADVFENEASMIHVGMPARVTLSYAGASSANRSLNGRVNYVQPQVDMTTRTLKVRIEADNPEMTLKPEMFVDVEFQVAMPSRVTVPAEAVLNSGLKKTVFVDLGNGFLEPRQVETGERAGGRIEITKGLRAGERVVVSGNFLIDSESQLKSAAAGMAGHQHGSVSPKADSPPTPPTAGEHKHD